MTPLGRPADPSASATTGPITRGRLHGRCLLHPVHGYYTTRDPVRRGGRLHHRARDQPDVRRADRPLPWRKPGWIRARPPPFTLAELGPGRGTLMADILRATRGVPGFHAAARWRWSKPRPACARCRRRPLAAIAADMARPASTTCPTRPLFLVANEFFDALPIRQFLRHAAGLARTAGRAAATDSWPSACPPPVPLTVLDTPPCATPHPATLVEHLPRPPRRSPPPSAAASRSHGGAGAVHRLWRLAVAGRHAAGAARAMPSPTRWPIPAQADLTAHVDFEAARPRRAPAPRLLTPQGALLNGSASRPAPSAWPAA